MRHLLPIEGESSYAKDFNSSAIVNTDINLLAEVKAKRKLKKDFVTMQEEINTLKKEIAEIKSHLNLS